MQKTEMINNRTNTGRNKTNNAVSKQKRSGNVKKTSKKSLSSMHPTREVVTIRKKDKAPFPWAVVVVTALFTCLFLFMMMNYAEVDKYRNELASLDNKVAAMQKSNDELQIILNNKFDNALLIEYATAMGMVPNNQITDRKVISIEHGDKTEMYNYDDGDEGGAGFLLAGIGEVLKDFLN